MSPWLIAGISGAAILSASFYTVHITSYEEGKAQCAADQATAQNKQNVKVKKVYDKIDRDTPYGASKLNSIKWLQQYTTDSK